MDEADNQGESVKGERALRDGDVDRLGFAEVATRIAQALVDRASADGLVVGLDGKWGSGKSSLLHLVETSLRKLPEGDRPTIINFRPWLVGDRDALLATFFGELADKVAGVQLARGDATAVTVSKAKKTAEAMRRFAYSLGKTGEFIEATGALYQPLGWVGKIIQGIGNWGKEKPQTDLAALKAELVTDLSELGHRFIITVDDVDRLEPGEVVEVLRLVRSVADFPNIIYVLCYDAEILSAAIRRGANVEDGAAFLEKIVQLTVMVPKPEPFQLRQWFAAELEPIIGSVADEVRERMKTTIDQEGAYQLRTPRSVVRTLDSVRFFWPALRKESADPADLVWLLLIKDGAPKLYRWIEDYVASASAASFGTTTITETGQQQRLDQLIACMGDQRLHEVYYRHFFAEQLPGIEADYGQNNPAVKIHQQVDPKVRQAAIDGKRLASPDHYRLYFSLIGPSHALTQASYDQFWTAAETSPGKTAEVLLNLHGLQAVGGLRKSDVMFERLAAMKAEVVSEAAAKNILLAFGEMMDQAYEIDPGEQFFVVTSWDRAEKLVPTLLSKLPHQERMATVEELFSRGVSLGWLTSIFRREIFAHGIFGDQRQPSEKWLLSAEDFEKARELMLARYRSMTLSQILAMPRAVHVFFAWNQGGNEEEPRALIASGISTDEGLVDVLESMLSTIDSSDRGRYSVLKREILSPFMDYDEVRERVRRIERSPSLKTRAERLSRAFNGVRWA